MIYCCGCYIRPHKTVFMGADFSFRDRKLEIAVCPKCGSLLAELTQFNIKTEEYEVYRPKRKKVGKFIRQVEDGKWNEIKVKYGTRENAGFSYGVNREYKDGRVCQFSVDFNGQKKLVKVING